MIPYISVVKYMREDEDFETTHIRVSCIKDGTKDIPLTEVQKVILIQALSASIDLDRIDNG